MLTCQAHIFKEYKTKKADVVWPNYHAVADYPEVCGGAVTVKVRAVDEPDYHSDHYAKLEVEAVCSRCRAPWVPGLDQLTQSDEIDLTPLLERQAAITGESEKL